MKDLLAIACEAASQAAELLRSEYANDARVCEASGKDIKTLADVAAQERILGVLDSTGIAVLAEEDDQHQGDLSQRIWLVDPLDGTLNFSRGFPMAAVSIALWENEKPVLGVIHDISNNEVYSGVVGQGAWLDGRRIEVSSVDEEAQAVLATGFPSGRDYGTDSLTAFVHSVQRYKKIRMLGSAALMLAQVAAGRFDVYDESDTYIWDVAAGLALVEAAGGTFSMMPGSGPHKYHVKATNGQSGLNAR